MNLGCFAETLCGTDRPGAGRASLPAATQTNVGRAATATDSDDKRV
jgi:hypothetical protein